MHNPRYSRIMLAGTALALILAIPLVQHGEERQPARRRTR